MTHFSRKKKNNEELIDFLITENVRVTRKLSEISSVNSRRRKQLKKNHKAFMRKNRDYKIAMDNFKLLNTAVKNSIKARNVSEQKEVVRLTAVSVALIVSIILITTYILASY